MRGRKYADIKVQQILKDFSLLKSKAATARSTGVNLSTVKLILNDPGAYMSKPLELTPDQIKSVKKMRAKGFSLKAIGNFVGKSDSYIHKICMTM